MRHCRLHQFASCLETHLARRISANTQRLVCLPRYMSSRAASRDASLQTRGRQRRLIADYREPTQEHDEETDVMPSLNGTRPHPPTSPRTFFWVSTPAPHLSHVPCICVSIYVLTRAYVYLYIYIYIHTYLRIYRGCIPHISLVASCCARLWPCRYVRMHKYM